MSSGKALWARISDLGTDTRLSTLTNKRIQISNWISIFCVAITFMFIGWYYAEGLTQLVFIESFGAILYAVPLLLNYFKFNLLSRIYLNTIVLVHIFFLSIMLGYQSGVYVFFVPTVMAPFALFEFTQRKVIASLCLFNVILVSVLFATIFRINFNIIQFTEAQIDLFHKLTFYVSIGCCVMIIYSILYTNEKTTARLDRDKERLVAQVEAIFNNSADALFLVDWEKRRIVKANRRAIELFEAEKEEQFFDMYAFDLHKTRPTQEEIDLIRKDIKDQGMYEGDVFYKTLKGKDFWGALTVKVIVVKGEKYQSIRVTDISEKRKAAEHMQSSLREKELLLAEVHHRVKNNLAIISGLLNLQADSLQDQHSKKIFADTKDRIYSMAMIHNQLYQHNSFAQIEFSQYIRNFCTYLSKSYQINPNIEILENTEKVQLDIKTAIPCALILNELITNAFKHAFKDQAVGQIDVGLKKENGNILFWVADTGAGMDSGFLQSTTMGMNLVHSLVEQIDGKLDFENKNGSRFLITFSN